MWKSRFPHSQISKSLLHLLQLRNRTAERSPALLQVGPDVSDLLDAGGHVADREGRRPDVAANHFVPRARRGNRRPFLRPDRIRGGERGAVIVAPGIDENPSRAIFLVELERELLRV